MAIRILTDSSADMPRDLIEKYDIIELPLSVHFGNDVYLDKVDIDSKKFYSMLKEAKELPKTSQVMPDAFERVFKEELDKGNEIVCILISSNASGTCQSANIALNEFDTDKIHLVDSNLLCMGTGYLVIKACKLLEEGKSASEIKNALDEMKNDIMTYFTVDTLDYLVKGGRIKKTKAVLAKTLNIKPVLTVEDGLTKNIDKVRGEKKVIPYLVEKLKEELDFDRNDYITVSYSQNPERAENLVEKIKSEVGFDKDIYISEVGPTIGTQ